MLGDQEVVSVRKYVSEYTSPLLSPLDSWRNSTPFFGMYALCTMDIGGFRWKTSTVNATHMPGLMQVSRLVFVV